MTAVQQEAQLPQPVLFEFKPTKLTKPLLLWEPTLLTVSVYVHFPHPNQFGIFMWQFSFRLALPLEYTLLVLSW